jgi:hypothetical protein
MHYLIAAAFAIPGVINLLPIAGVFGAKQLETLYGISFVGEDLLLLMRHRAVLIALVGVYLLLAAFRPRHRNPAAAAGLISMISYELLALPLAGHGAPIQRVFWFDIVATVLLGIGCWLSSRSSRSARLRP